MINVILSLDSSTGRPRQLATLDHIHVCSIVAYDNHFHGLGDCQMIHKLCVIMYLNHFQSSKLWKQFTIYPLPTT